MIKRYSILNIKVDSVDMQQALDRVVEFVEKGNKLHTIFAVNPEKHFSLEKDPLLYRMFEKADMLLPDGIGIVLAARILHGKKLKRVPGCEFMQNTCGLAAEKGYKIFIYGAKEEINKAAVDELKQRHPEIKIVGRTNGYLPEEKMDSLVDRINESGAQILYLALGSPRQEMWITKYQMCLQHVKVCQGIGGTLDVIAGNVKRAPAFYCAVGLEWLYRLMAEPKRIKRQRLLPLFAWRVFREKLGSAD
jgi:N-acetylglucosaminyldiphosphoundecaprenol N-acetyl-beta-D-mannosaminyltransferase